MQTYHIPKPKTPIQLWLLGALATSGLAALWLAAFNAFQQIAGPIQAGFAATLIEAGLIIEATAYIRYRTWYALVGLSVSVVVSGIYNYVQVIADNNTLTIGPSIALALGPLSALTFIALAFGDVLKRHQTAVEEWQKAQTTWLENEARKQEEQTAEAREHQRKLDADERDYQRKSAERARKRRERHERMAERSPQPSERPQTTPNARKRSDELDELLTIVHERSGGQPFRQADIQRWTERKKTVAYRLIGYGKKHGEIEQIERGLYQISQNGASA
ncbi:MAG: hypothetical protein AAF485_05080 [Chloroflexota bacterium]